MPPQPQQQPAAAPAAPPAGPLADEGNVAQPLTPGAEQRLLRELQGAVRSWVPGDRQAARAVAEVELHGRGRVIHGDTQGRPVVTEGSGDD